MPDMTDQELYAHSDDGATSDDERLALAPADGYFAGSSSTQHGAGESQLGQQLAGRGPMSANVPFVPAVMVEDPSLRQDAVAEAKAREAAEERPSPEYPVSEPEPSHRVDSSDNFAESQLPSDAAASSPVPLVTSTDHITPHSPTTADQLTPVQSPTVQSPVRQQPSYHRNVYNNLYSDAPPAYSPGPSRSYGAVPTSPLASLPPSQEIATSDERQPLLSPAAQSETLPFPDPEVPIIPHGRFKWTTGKKGFRKRAILIFATLFALIVITVITFGIVAISKQKKHHLEEEPVKPPEEPDGELQWRPPPRCLDTNIKDRITLGQSYHFDTHSNLTILQKSDNKGVPGGRPVHTFGELILRPATNSSPVGYYAIESVANSNYLGFVSDTSESGTLKILSPGEIEWQGELDPCIQLRISLFVPAGATLRALDVQATHLDIKIMKGLAMSVAEVAQFLSWSGDITVPERPGNQSIAPYRLESPNLFAQSVRGHISGWFPIYQELLFAVRYGNLWATVSHQPPKSNYPGPSKLTVLSKSGNVTIRETTHSQSRNALPRDHQIDIDTNSGNVYADMQYSSIARIKSLSGNLNLSLSPGWDSDCLRWGYQFCVVQTEAGSGNTHVVINEPPGHPSSSLNMDLANANDKKRGVYTDYGAHATMSALSSVHTSSYGDVVAKYPASWEGTVAALTITGDMDYRGKGLVMKLWDAITKRMKGKKGNGGSSMVVNTRSGNQKVVIGDEEED